MRPVFPFSFLPFYSDKRVREREREISLAPFLPSRLLVVHMQKFREYKRACGDIEKKEVRAGKRKDGWDDPLVDAGDTMRDDRVETPHDWPRF